MQQSMTQEERYQMMMDTPIPRLISKLAVPTIVSMLITAIYNMADTFFVSRIGTSASGAVGIIASFMFLIQAIGFTFGMGSGNYISRSLGDQNGGEAGKAASTAFFSVFFIGIFMMIFGIIYMEKVVYLLGATSTIAPFAMSYMRYILYAAPFMLCSYVMNNILRAQGIAMYAMFGIAAGGILNIILDPVLIFGFHMGIAGAAIATMISQIVSFGILLCQCNFRKDSIKIQLSKFSPTLRMYGIILHGGLPSLCRQGMMSISSVVLNVTAGPYGDAAIAAMSIVSRFMMFINSGLIGFGQGFQPVCGFNFGAKRYDRVLESFWFCFKVSTVVLTGLGLISFGLARPIIALFRREDLKVIEIGSRALRLQLLTMPIQGWIIMCNMMTQSIGYGFRASLVAMGRQGLFLVPALWILSGVFGLLGVQMAQAVADVFTFALASAIIAGILKDFKQKALYNKEGFGI
ncbi:MAG: MATE family efflux transporter [Lachnospiraceae bacterium]|jgi:putative MATE family efflux protein|nr:MATE family efflux transporter [Lachnospiraceae bacterium]